MLLKKKISVGFVILGFILLLSSLIAIFEFVTMRRTIGKFVKDDITSINTTRKLLDMADQYNFELLSTMGDSTYTDVNTINNRIFRLSRVCARVLSSAAQACRCRLVRRG